MLFFGRRVNGTSTRCTATVCWRIGRRRRVLWSTRCFDVSMKCGLHGKKAESKHPKRFDWNYIYIYIIGKYDL